MVVTAVAGSVAAAMLVASMLIVGKTCKTRRRRQQESDEAVIIQDMPGFMEVNVSLKVVSTNSHHCNLG